MRLVRGIAATFAAACALAAQAGGPLEICANQGVKYPGTGTVTLNYDGGGALGPRTKAQADAIVSNSVSLWTNVGTATVAIQRGSDLGVDVNSSNYSSYFNSFSDGLNPVIYDSDGSIVDSLLGVGAKNSVLGFAGSAYNGSTCQYVEGRAVISGFLNVSDATMGIVIAHEVGHMIGLDHTQLDGSQGLASGNYPLMYPVAYRGTLSLHEDDVAAVSALYPDATLNSVYGEISGNVRAADGVTPVRGANIWAQEVSTGKVYSVVSDYLMQGNGYFRLLLPAGTYTLRAEAIDSSFTGGSSVGPYADTYPTSVSFQPPLYSGGTAMTPVALGGATPVRFAIVAGCRATATFSLSGAGSVTGNCVGKTTPAVSLASSLNPANAGQTVTLSASVSGGTGTATGTMNFRDGGSSIAGCSAVALTNGSAACAISTLVAGSHSITAAYSGDTSYNTATSSTLTQSIQAVTTPPPPPPPTPTTNPAGVSSLIVHYYQAILRRDPDAGGQAYWEGEASRLQSLGASVNEVFYALAMSFFGSSEYASLNRDNAGFVTDMYQTFFNRGPDAGGLVYWTGQITSGLPRDAVLASFLFSPEFATFMQTTLGNTTARAEVNMVMDFYRGVLGRLPDTGGFSYWLQQFRTAQCQGPFAVAAQVESISGSFVGSAEYAGRSRNNTQYVDDLYNAFLRRGADVGGLQAWVNTLNAGTTRDNLRRTFVNSIEFTTRVNAVVAQGCLP